MKLLCFQLGFQTVTVDFSVTSPNLIYARARSREDEKNTHKNVLLMLNRERKRNSRRCGRK